MTLEIKTGREIQIPEASAGGTEDVKLDCIDYLRGETIDSVVIAQIGTQPSVLNISGKQVNTVQLTILGRVNAAGQAVQYRVSNIVPGEYQILVTLTTSTSRVLPIVARFRAR